MADEQALCGLDGESHGSLILRVVITEFLTHAGEDGAKRRPQPAQRAEGAP
jgi:hypothetical protein